jgi:hypothetical protein
MGGIWPLPTPLARALVDEGVTRLTECASFLASQKLQPAPGAMRFARRAAQIVIQAGFAAKLLPPKSASDKAKATIAHVASAFAILFDAGKDISDTN